jgi:hypothetical protein
MNPQLVIEAWKINQKFVPMKFNMPKQGKLHERQATDLNLWMNDVRCVGNKRRRQLWYKLPLPLYLLPLACFFVFGSFMLHPFYMSVTEIEYRPAQKELQIACKIFTDDLEDALKAETKRQVSFADEKQTKNNKELIQNYLQQHLKIEVDGKALAYEMIGFEKEQEAVWSYLEIKNVNAFKTATVYNDALYHLREGQINIIHFKVKGVTQSYRLNAPAKWHRFQW